MAKFTDFGGQTNATAPRTLTLEWNGLDDRGEPLPDGEYPVRGVSHPGVTFAYDWPWWPDNRFDCSRRSPRRNGSVLDLDNSSAAVQIAVRQVLFVGRDRIRDDAEILVVEPAFERLIGADDVHAASAGDSGFDSHPPIGGVDDETAQTGGLEILGAAHGGLKDAGSLAFTGLPVLEPSDGQRLQFWIRRIVVVPALERLPPDQGGAVRRQTRPLFLGSVNVRVTPDVAHTDENGMILLFRNDVAAGRVSVPVAVVAPGRFLPEHLLPSGPVFH